jgi:hypothetical protein
MRFHDYLAAAWAKARQEAEEIEFFHTLCRTGVSENHQKLEQLRFLEAYHRCIAVIAKRADVVEMHWDNQVVLFRNHDVSRIVHEQARIRREWSNKKCFLSPKMVDAMIRTGKLLDESGWKVFKARYLLLPENPESESLEDWAPAHGALDILPMVGNATAWYLIRNLYGARVFKPDVFICRITDHFFPGAKSPWDALAQAVHEAWDQVCHEDRFRPVHLGEVDYVLWWYARKTGLPSSNKAGAG